MELSQLIRKVVLADLENIDLTSLPSYALANHSIISFLYRSNILDDSSIENVLRTAVMCNAARYYGLVVSSGGEFKCTNPVRPELLAYAIQHGRFTETELKRIKFVHGKTAETFCKTHRTNNLLEKLRYGLLNPGSLPFDKC